MESKLKEILETNQPENRYKLVQKLKDKGVRIIGLISNYVPEEIFTAGGFLPFRITGTWKESIELAKTYRPENSCGFCNHVLESYLSGELDFLDGIVGADIDQDVVRLLDVMSYVRRLEFIQIIHVPFTSAQLNCEYFANELKKLCMNLSVLSGKKITDEDLLSAVALHDEIRDSLRSIYEMRKRIDPPLSGTEVLQLLSAACVSPRSEFLEKIKELIPYISRRRANLARTSPRLMVISDMLDHPGYLKIIEDEGAVVVMDDMDLGSRYVYLPPFDGSGDPFFSLAKRYLTRHGSARMASWKNQAERIVEWVREFNVDGVLGMPLTWCYPQQYRAPYLSSVLDQRKIPNIFIDREYHLANLGQLKTRIGAFIESLVK